MDARKKLDVIMTVLMIAAMSYQTTGNLLHELAGVLLLLLFLVHHGINRKWYASLSRGRYSRYRTVLLIVNMLTLISMLAAMGTGIYISQRLFAPLWGMREAYLIRPLHVAAGSWGTILVSIHGGLHIPLPKKKKPLMLAGGGLAAVLGILAFIALDMPSRLILRDMGMYWSYPGALLFAANAAVMILFMGIGAAAGDILKKKPKSKSDKIQQKGDERE